MISKKMISKKKFQKNNSLICLGSTNVSEYNYLFCYKKIEYSFLLIQETSIWSIDSQRVLVFNSSTTWLLLFHIIKGKDLQNSSAKQSTFFIYLNVLDNSFWKGIILEWIGHWLSNFYNFSIVQNLCVNNWDHSFWKW